MLGKSQDPTLCTSTPSNARSGLLPHRNPPPVLVLSCVCLFSVLFHPPLCHHACMCAHCLWHFSNLSEFATVIFRFIPFCLSQKTHPPRSTFWCFGIKKMSDKDISPKWTLDSIAHNGPIYVAILRRYFIYRITAGT